MMPAMIDEHIHNMILKRCDKTQIQTKQIKQTQTINHVTQTGIIKLNMIPKAKNGGIINSLSAA